MSKVTKGEIIQIEGALRKLVSMDEKLAVESAYRINKTLKVLSEEVKVLLESIKAYVEYEKMVMAAAQAKDNELIQRLYDNHFSEIQEARVFLDSPFDGESIPRLKLSMFKRSDGTGVDIPTGLMSVLMPIVDE